MRLSTGSPGWPPQRPPRDLLQALQCCPSSSPMHAAPRQGWPRSCSIRGPGGPTRRNSRIQRSKSLGNTRSPQGRNARTVPTAAGYSREPGRHHLRTSSPQTPNAEPQNANCRQPFQQIRETKRLWVEQDVQTLQGTESRFIKNTGILVQASVHVSIPRPTHVPHFYGVECLGGKVKSPQ